MTIDDAIEHERRVAREHGYGEKDPAYHMQLAEWLRQARGADKAARWYTKKIEELENRANALARLLDETTEERDGQANENKELRSLLSDYYNAPCFNCDPWSDSWGGCMHSDCGNCMLAKKAVELGISERE